MTIKFRALGKDNIWRYGVYPFESVDMGNTTYAMLVFWQLFPSLRRETLGQFANMFDKTIQEIYEGDIVQKINDPRYYEVVIHHSGVLPVHDDQLSSRPTGSINPSIDFLPLNVLGKHPTDTRTDGILIAETWKIVGNIYENPEILENERKQI